MDIGHEDIYSFVIYHSGCCASYAYLIFQLVMANCEFHQYLIRIRVTEKPKLQLELELNFLSKYMYLIIIRHVSTIRKMTTACPFVLIFG